MKPKLFFLLIILSACSLTALAQKVRLQSINQIGLVSGDLGSHFTLQTINGIRYRGFAAGLGIGYDPYETPTLPVFLDLRQRLHADHSSFFVYADGGWSLPLNKTERKDYFVTALNREGMYVDAGIGYAFRFARGEEVLLSAGYSQKGLSQDEKLTPPPNVDPIRPFPAYHYDYTFRRYVVKLGLRL